MLVVLTKPLLVKLDRAGMEVVAKVEVPVTAKVPPTVRRLDIVVEPVMAKVLLPVNCRLEEVATTPPLLPNKISLAVRL